MKRLLPIFVLLLTGACGKKNNGEYIIVSIPEQEAKQNATTKIITSNSYDVSDELIWQGNIYTYDIKKEPDKSVPIVKTENGQRFYNNKITLEIMRDDGSTFFSHTFRKNDFASFLDANMLKEGILESVIFINTESGNIQFSSAISYPQTDAIAPFAININANGNLSISKDTDLDVNNLNN